MELEEDVIMDLISLMVSVSKVQNVDMDGLFTLMVITMKENTKKERETEEVSS